MFEVVSIDLLLCHIHVTKGFKNSSNWEIGPCYNNLKIGFDL